MIDVLFPYDHSPYAREASSFLNLWKLAGDGVEKWSRGDRAIDPPFISWRKNLYDHMDPIGALMESFIAEIKTCINGGQKENRHSQREAEDYKQWIAHMTRDVS